MGNINFSTKRLFSPKIEGGILSERDITCIFRGNVEPTKRDIEISMLCITRELEDSLTNLI